MMIAYDLTRLTPGGVKVTHHECVIRTDGPWLIVGEDPPQLIVPAHATVALEPCEGACRDGRE